MARPGYKNKTEERGTVSKQKRVAGAGHQSRRRHMTAGLSYNDLFSQNTHTHTDLFHSSSSSETP